MSLQDRFLNSARKSKASLTIFLVKGVKLQGVITWFDAFSILLRRDGQTQLIYKHSISTIMPSRPLEMEQPDSSEAASKASLQDRFLSAAARERQQMTVFLVNGVMLEGSIAAYDQFCLLLERSELAQLVYKHAISTMQPDRPLSIGEQHEGQGEE